MSDRDEVDGQLRALYERVPYPSLPYRPSHPDSLAATAALAGFAAAAPPVEGCRILEIGCSAGGNLLPMAATLPGARLLGIDLSPPHVERATQTARAAEFTNVQFRCQDLRTFDDPETFDYIIAHGVYSWVPADARDRLLALCRRLLSPRGVAYLSYNTYPGWHVRGMLREAAIIGSVGAIDQAGLARGRQIVAALATAARGANANWGAVVGAAADPFLNRSDGHLLHDDFEPVNDPVYFHAFAAHAQRHGLRLLAAADAAAEPWHRLPADVRRQLRELAHNEIELEQYIDLVVNRAFRQSVLCRADAPAVAADPAHAMRRSFVASPLAPIDGPADGPARFRGAGHTVEVANALTASAIRSLARHWPAVIPFGQVVEEASAGMSASSGEDVLVQHLLSLHASGLLEVWTRDPGIVRAVPGERVRVSPLARVQAAGHGPVTNLRHEACDLPEDLRAALRDAQAEPAQAIVEQLGRQSFLLK